MVGFVVSRAIVNGKADYDMSGVSFEDATYPYDGKEKTLEITGQLPEGVTVSYENNTLTNAGSVRAKAEFTVADTEHYNEIDEGLYADLATKATPTITIKPDQATLTGSGTVTLGGEARGRQGHRHLRQGEVTVTDNGDGASPSVTVSNGSTGQEGRHRDHHREARRWLRDRQGDCHRQQGQYDHCHRQGRRQVQLYDARRQGGREGDLREERSQARPVQQEWFCGCAENSWYADAADFVAQRGLMSGVGENFFGGSQNTTRAMLMTILACMDGQDVTGGATWYEKAMNWAKQTGVSDGTMPEVNITREQLATMLYSYAKLKGMDPIPNGMALSKFSDADSISTWASEAVSWAAYSGIISGRSNGTVDPQAGATRAEMAVMLQQFVKLAEK
ncbi:MAG: S-layer homology domain-containing protein [Lawsonibacter sp.]